MAKLHINLFQFYIKNTWYLFRHISCSISFSYTLYVISWKFGLLFGQCIGLEVYTVCTVVLYVILQAYSYVQIPYFVVLYSVQYTQDAIPRHEPFIFVFDEVSLKSSQFTISVIGRSCNSYFFLVFTRHWGCKYIFGEREGEILSVQRSNLHELPAFFFYQGL